MLAVEALFDMNLLNCRPSMVAATLLYAERRLRGAVPFWPTSLAKMTGYEDLTTPEIACAVRTAQKLCKKWLYADIYKSQGQSLVVAAKVAATGADVAGGLVGVTTAAAAATAAAERLMLPASDSAMVPAAKAVGFAAAAPACGRINNSCSVPLQVVGSGQLVQLPANAAPSSAPASTSRWSLGPLRGLGSNWGLQSLPVQQQEQVQVNSRPVSSLLLPMQQGQQQEVQGQQGVGDQRQGSLLLLSDTAMAALRGSALGAVGSTTGRQSAAAAPPAATAGLQRQSSNLPMVSLGGLQSLDQSGVFGQSLGMGLVGTAAPAAVPQSQATQGLEGLALSLQALGIAANNVGQRF